MSCSSNKFMKIYQTVDKQTDRHTLTVPQTNTTETYHLRRLRYAIAARVLIIIITRGQNNLTKNAARRAHSPVRGHPRGSKVVPLNSWGRVSY